MLNKLFIKIADPLSVIQIHKLMYFGCLMLVWENVVKLSDRVLENSKEMLNRLTLLGKLAMLNRLTLLGKVAILNRLTLL